jgi:hypothetical protein
LECRLRTLDNAVDTPAATAIIGLFSQRFRGVSQVEREFRKAGAGKDFRCSNSGAASVFDQSEKIIVRNSSTPLGMTRSTIDRERNRDDLERLDYCLAVMHACAMLQLSSNQLMVLREQPEAMPA